IFSSPNIQHPTSPSHPTSNIQHSTFSSHPTPNIQHPTFSSHPTSNIQHPTFSSHPTSNIQHPTFNKVLIIKPSSLGDVVRCLPILAGLRVSYPDAHLAWLVRPDCAEILKSSPILDEIIYFDRKLYGNISWNLTAARDFIRFLKDLRQQKFDLVIDLQGLFRSAFIAYCTTAPTRLGFARAREFASAFYTHRITTPNQSEHIVDSYWRFAEYLGFGDLQKNFDLHLDPQLEKESINLLHQNGIDSNTPYTVLLIGGTKKAKRWPPQHFAELAQTLHQKYQLNSILIGAGEIENNAAQQLIQHAHDKKIIGNLVNKTNLLQAAAIMKNSRLVVGNDSGPLHIAAAMSVPLVGLYGPTNPSVVGPYGQLDSVVLAAPDLPQNQRYSTQKKHQIDNIKLQNVVINIEKKLKT
ncbi:MAG: lipopolysaccharide heptosyltransferase I, partial [Planctomycetes bacterium]|nr:lipopolysaccharide heptosyltransferase I [Planctomycetota bacterium]